MDSIILLSSVMSMTVIAILNYTASLDIRYQSINHVALKVYFIFVAIFVIILLSLRIKRIGAVGIFGMRCSKSNLSPVNSIHSSIHATYIYMFFIPVNNPNKQFSFPSSLMIKLRIMKAMIYRYIILILIYQYDIFTSRKKSLTIIFFARFCCATPFNIDR